jgi:hypothetical protein
MAHMLCELPETVTPTVDDTRLAQESSPRPDQLGEPRLAKLVGPMKKNVRFRIQPDDEPEESIVIPLSAFRLLADLLTEMAKGNAVTPDTHPCGTDHAAGSGRA